MEQFDQILNNASQSVPQSYFQLPVTGRENPAYRERVYCYELYHQIRSLWPILEEYSLSGEIDKKGHPKIHGNGLDNKKPDFLIHIPGEEFSNYLIIEVKPINAKRKDLLKDLKTLTAFRKHANYSRAILLIYGQTANGIDKVKKKLINIAQEEGTVENSVEINLIEFWHHSEPGTPAQHIEW